MYFWHNVRARVHRILYKIKEKAEGIKCFHNHTLVLNIEKGFYFNLHTFVLNIDKGFTSICMVALRVIENYKEEITPVVLLNATSEHTIIMELAVRISACCRVKPWTIGRGNPCRRCVFTYGTKTVLRKTRITPCIDIKIY